MESNKVNEARQFVVFKLGKEEYGADIRQVTEIKEMMPIARVPKTPDFVKGVMNLRGEIIPIIDLRARFNMPRIEVTEDTRIIIAKIDDIAAGMIVDAVMGVIQLNDEAVENITNITNDFSTEFIYGVGKVDKRLVTLLSLDKLIRLNDKE